jgi:hypothetical protein
MNQKTIETIAVNAVKNSIVMSELLDEFIADNDKEPSWDGFVYIYEDNSKKKEKLKGRIPVQVKGHVCENHSKEKISFLMSTVDLNNYLEDGGCILFVVYIGNNGLTNKIYYVELTPIKLRKILEEAKEQKNKTIYLKEFPTDNNRKNTIFLNCLQNCQKQASFKEGTLFSLDELEKQGILENIVIPISGVGITDDPQRAIIENDVYIYAIIKGSSIPQPISFIPKDIHTRETVEALITINDKIFYREYQVEKSAEGTKYCYGDSFVVQYNEAKQNWKISYRNSSKVRVLVKDLDFMLAYIKYGYFLVDNERIMLDYETMDFTNFNIEKEEERLKHAKKIVKVLEILNCSEDIDINDMTAEDKRNLERLITAFIDKKTVKGLRDGLPPVICLGVGKLKFAVYLKKCGEKGTYEIYDFFKVKLSVAFKDEENKGEMLPISQFSILHEKDLLSFNNIDFDILLPSFQSTNHHHETFNRANWFLIDLLNAYDKASGERKEKLLNTCKAFSNWIFEASDEELDYQTKMLNKLQTIKRYRKFNDAEIKSLCEMVEAKNTREECVVGAYLLLDQQKAAKIHFLKLSKKEQDNFKQYPIYHYMQ